MNKQTQIAIYQSKPRERSAIGAIAGKTGVFNSEELETVYELFDSFLKGKESGYEFFSAGVNGALAGFVCWGDTPLTQGVYDIYWICTDPAYQKGGVGKALFEAVEKEVRHKDGRMIVIWTSGTNKYLPAVRFYQRMGCILAGRIKDYYRIGDDLLILIKNIHPSGIS